MRIGVLSNLRAGQRDSKVDAVLGFLRRHPDVLHVETERDAAVPPALRDFARAGVEILVLNGGDGTIQHALTHLLGNPANDWRPWIAPIRGGRTNMTATDLGARRDPVRGLGELIAADRAGRLAERIRVRPVLRVAIAEGVHYGMFLGLGVLHRAVHLVHQVFPDGKAQGVFGAGLVTGVLIARSAAGGLRGVLTPDKMRISVDGDDPGPREQLLAMATTHERLFLGMRPFWGREPAPVRVTHVEGGARRLGRAAPGILRGRPPAWARPELGYRSRNAHELAIQLDAGLILDGEPYDPMPDRVVRVGAVEGVRFLRA
jgi:diacylglycerol kinase family enzyme